MYRRHKWYGRWIGDLVLAIKCKIRQARTLKRRVRVDKEDLEEEQYIGECRRCVTNFLFRVSGFSKWLVWCHHWWLWLMTFVWFPFKMVSVTEDITQTPRDIIKHTNLYNLRLDDFLAICRLKILSLVSWGWCGVGWTWRLFSFKAGHFRMSTTTLVPKLANPFRRKIHTIPNPQNIKLRFFLRYRDTHILPTVYLRGKLPIPRSFIISRLIRIPSNRITVLILIKNRSIAAAAIIFEPVPTSRLAISVSYNLLKWRRMSKLRRRGKIIISEKGLLWWVIFEEARFCCAAGITGIIFTWRFYISAHDGTFFSPKKR